MNKKITSGIISLIISLLGCLTFFTPTPLPTMTVDELIEILEDPEAESFSLTIQKLDEMGKEAAPASKALAKAMQYPYRDSYMAALVLIEIGPLAQEAVPEVVQALKDERSLIRAEAAIILGIIGESSQCAVPDLALLLWDNISEVRASSARALDAITQMELVKYSEKLLVDTGLFYDDGEMSAKAREWWQEEGQYMDWGPSCAELEN